MMTPGNVDTMLQSKRTARGALNSSKQSSRPAALCAILESGMQVERATEEALDPPALIYASVFSELMARPALGWSRQASRSMLGHYDPSHNAIVLSRILDRAETPALAVEYVLFHEMLHLRYPAQHHGARRCVHTREFKMAERQFERFR